MVPLIEEDTLIVALPPLQISVALELIINTGLGYTFIVTLPVVTQPSGLVTVTL